MFRSNEAMSTASVDAMRKAARRVSTGLTLSATSSEDCSLSSDDYDSEDDSYTSSDDDYCEDVHMTDRVQQNDNNNNNNNNNNNELVVEEEQDDDDFDMDDSAIRIHPVSRMDIEIEEENNNDNNQEAAAETETTASRDNNSRNHCSFSSYNSSEFSCTSDDYGTSDEEEWSELMEQMPVVLSRRPQQQPTNQTPAQQQQQQQTTATPSATVSPSAPSSQQQDHFSEGLKRLMAAGNSNTTTPHTIPASPTRKQPISPRRPQSPRHQPSRLQQQLEALSRGSSLSSANSILSSNASGTSNADEESSEYSEEVGSMPRLPPSYASLGGTSHSRNSSQGGGRMSRRGSMASSGGRMRRRGSMASSSGSSVYSESEWSSSDDDDDDDSDYEDLMGALPIALGRRNVQGVLPNRPAPMPMPIRRPAPLPPRPAVPQPQACVDIPEMTDPMEGLAMFQNIRKDLEKVGRLIVKNKDGEKFLERAHILASINWLAPNVPTCVLDHLGQEIRKSLDKPKKKPVDTKQQQQQQLVDMVPPSQPKTLLEKTVMIPKSDDTTDDDSVSSDISDHEEKMEIMDTSRRSLNRPLLGRHISYEPSFREKDDDGLPHVSNFEGALLFVDISGFTKLSTMMDPENLSKAINSYFQQIVGKVAEFGGDVQKYAGDAIFVEWRSSSTIKIERCVEAAAACSLALVRDCANFPVLATSSLADKSSPIASLNVHCGLGVGEMLGFHVGDSSNRREYLSLGDPITQATEACDWADLGEVMASKKFIEILAKVGLAKKPEDYYEELKQFNDETIERLKVTNPLLGPRNAKSRGVTDHVDGLQVDALKEYRRLMSLYAHPVVVSNDVAAANDFKSSARSGTDQDNRREDAELRSVYTMFIKPQVDVKLRGDHGEVRKFINLVNSIMRLVTRELNHHVGHLRQCIVDDKGLVLIATFGLRGSTFPNMVTERALPATFSLSRGLEMELGVKCSIGATFGDLYCGAVGGEKRHEYAVMGPSCNLAARLMCSPKNPGILVDNAVRKMAAKGYCFNALEPVRAKGYKDLVPIFEPLAPVVCSWGKIEPHFVGRNEEIGKIVSLAKQMALEDYAAPKIAIISSANGMGKSALLVQAIERIRRMFDGRKGLIISKHAGRDCESLKPFSAVRHLLLNLLSTFHGLGENASVATGFTGMASRFPCDQSFGSNHEQSTYASTVRSNSQITKAFDEILSEMRPPDLMALYLRKHLLGTEVPKDVDKVPSMRSIANFIAHIFAACCEEHRMVILALDDIHTTDEMSWIVLQSVFETADNVLMLGTTQSERSMALRMEKDFLEKLNTEYAKNGRYLKMEIGRLSREEVLTMTMKTLGLKREEVTKELLDEVYVQSGGSPHFADRILEAIQHRDCSETEMGSNEAEKYVEEILLHRVDTFDVSVRSALNIGAVLGNSFTLGEIMSVLKENCDLREADLRKQTISSLQNLVKEGILFVGERQEDINHQNTEVGEDPNTQFTFCQASWRSTVLRLMLGSRKRDVHRKIAQTMEGEMKDREICYKDINNIWRHWVETGDANRASKAALMTADLIEDDTEDLLDINEMFEETLKMWTWSPIGCYGSIGGFSQDILNVICAADLSQIFSVLIARGRLFSTLERHEDSIASYQKVLEIKESAPSFSQIKDHSVIFPAFVEICKAISKGYLEQDVHRRYEQDIIFQFLKETRSNGRRIHHIYALYLQMQLFAQLEEVDKAIAVHSIIKQTYIPEKHSKGLRETYGKDSGALSFTLCAYLQSIQKNQRQAMKTCRFVLKEMFPKIPTNISQSFDMVYPLIFVLKRQGFSNEARGLFEKALVIPFARKQNDETPLFAVRKPLTVLLALSGKNEINDDTLQQYIQWASEIPNLSFDTETNLHLGRLGCCGHSISADICASLASRMPLGKARDSLVSQGSALVSNGVALMRRHRLKLALSQLYEVQAKLDALGLTKGAISLKRKYEVDRRVRRDSQVHFFIVTRMEI